MGWRGLGHARSPPPPPLLRRPRAAPRLALTPVPLPSPQVQGTVVRVDQRGAHVDIGGKSTAFCPTAELALANIPKVSPWPCCLVCDAATLCRGACSLHAMRGCCSCLQLCACQHGSSAAERGGSWSGSSGGPWAVGSSRQPSLSGLGAAAACAVAWQCTLGMASQSAGQLGFRRPCIAGAAPSPHERLPGRHQRAAIQTARGWRPGPPCCPAQHGRGPHTPPHARASTLPAVKLRLSCCACPLLPSSFAVHRGGGPAHLPRLHCDPRGAQRGPHPVPQKAGAAGKPRRHAGVPESLGRAARPGRALL